MALESKWNGLRQRRSSVTSAPAPDAPFRSAVAKIGRLVRILHMSNRKRRPRQQPPTKIKKSDPQTAEMLTVGWMLSVMTALLCEVGFVLARAYVLLVDSAASRIAVLAGMLLFAAAVVGAISLALCAVVARMRREPTPGGVIAVAVVIGAIPLVAIVLGALRQA